MNVLLNEVFIIMSSFFIVCLLQDTEDPEKNHIIIQDICSNAYITAAFWSFLNEKEVIVFHNRFYYSSVFMERLDRIVRKADIAPILSIKGRVNSMWSHINKTVTGAFALTNLSKSSLGIVNLIGLITEDDILHSYYYTRGSTSFVNYTQYHKRSIGSSESTNLRDNQLYIWPYNRTNSYLYIHLGDELKLKNFNVERNALEGSYPIVGKNKVIDRLVESWRGFSVAYFDSSNYIVFGKNRFTYTYKGVEEHRRSIKKIFFGCRQNNYVIIYSIAVMAIIIITISLFLFLNKQKVKIFVEKKASQ